MSTPSRFRHSSTILAPGSLTDSSILGAPTWPPIPPRSRRPGKAVAPLGCYALGAPSADASRARRRACAADSRAIGIMNGEQDT